VVTPTKSDRGNYPLQGLSIYQKPVSELTFMRAFGISASAAASLYRDREMIAEIPDRIDNNLLRTGVVVQNVEGMTTFGMVQ